MSDSIQKSQAPWAPAFWSGHVPASGMASTRKRAKAANTRVWRDATLTMDRDGVLPMLCAVLTRARIDICGPDHLAVPTFWPQALLCCLVTLVCACRLPLHELRDNRLLVACKAVVTGSRHGTKEPFNGIAMLYVKLNTSLRAAEYVNRAALYCYGSSLMTVGSYICAINVHTRINLNCWHWRCRE